MAELLPASPQPPPNQQPMAAPQPTAPQDISVEAEEVTGTGEPTAEARREEELREEKSAQYDLSSDQKKEIVDYVISCVDNCVASRSKWKETLDDCMKLYEGHRDPKSDPWENCSNISTMAVPTHCNLMHSKLFPAAWNENNTFWQPVGLDDVKNVQHVRVFMDWVIRKELKLADTVDDLIHDIIVYGTIAIKVRWGTEYRYVRDKDKGPGTYKEVAHQRVYVDFLPIENVYLPYLWKGEDDSEFIAHDSFMRIPDIKSLRDRGILKCSDEDIEAIKAKITEEDGGGEANRTRAESEGSQTYTTNVNSAPVRLIEIFTKWMIGGKLVESNFIVDYKSRTYLSGKPLTAISPIGRRPIIIGQFIRRTNRPYGIGLPEVMRGLAKELDAIHNQRIDAGSISIAPFGFYRAASSFKPAKVQIGPGVFIPVDDIKDVQIAQFPNNFVTSFQEERIIIEYIEKLTATSAYQMGRESDVVKSRATASGTLALISQGEQAYTLLGLRVQRVIAKMLTKILQEYQTKMPAGFANRVLADDAGRLLFPDGLTPEEIDGGYDCYMALDSTAGNKAMERQVNAVLVQMAPNLLALTQSPRGYEMAKEFMISIGKMDYERFLGPRPKKEPSTPGGIPMGPGMELTGAAGGGIGPATF